MKKKKNRKKEKSNKNLKPFWQTNKIQANGGKKLFEKKNFFLFLSSFNERWKEDEKRRERKN